MKKSFYIFLVLLLSSKVFSQNINVSEIVAKAVYSVPVVQDIKASISKGTKVNVYWSLPQNMNPSVSQLLLYRTTTPVINYSQLNNVKPLAQLPKDSTGYLDTLTDYRDYFYTVILVTDKPYDLIFVSMNTTAIGVHLEQPKQTPTEQKQKEEKNFYLNGTLRETPLPFLDYVEGLNKEELLSEKTINVTKTLTGKEKDKTVYSVNPYFFEEDLISPDGGDDYVLFEVLKNTFVQEKYDQAIVQLKQITAANINQNVQNRAYFYIAEAQYFTGDYEEAVKTFVKVSQYFPSLSKEWINRVLDTLSLPR